MQLEIKLGTAVVVALDGHSAINGAVIPENSTIELTSNDPTVATVPATLTVPAGGAQHIEADVTVLAVGSTDIHAKVTTPDGSIFEDTSTLLVDPAPIPGLVSITVTLSEKA